MRDFFIWFIAFCVIIGSLLICDSIDGLNQTIKEKQIVLNIQEFQWDVEAQNGSVINLPGEGK